MKLFSMMNLKDKPTLKKIRKFAKRRLYGAS